MQRWHGTHVFDQLRVVDSKKMYFGASQDVYMEWNGTVFQVIPATDDTGAFNIGNGTADFDFKVFLGTTGDYAEFDVGNKRLNMVRATFTENEKCINVDVTVSDATKGTRQGAVAIALERTTVMTNSDGNPDCALKISAKNKTASSSYCRTRGLDINVKVDNSPNASFAVYGALITAETESGTTLNTSGELVALEVHAKNNGNAGSANIKCLRVYDESQSSTGTSYAIEIDCTNNSPFTREYCVYINSGASSGWTNGLTFDGNITNALDFADTDGTNGATIGTYSSADANPSGHIRVDIGGNTRYIYVYTNPVTFS